MSHLPAPDNLAALQQKNRQVTRVLDSMPAFVCYMDQDLNYQVINQTYLDWLGLTEDQVIGKNISDILNNEFIDRAKPYFMKAMEGETVSYTNEIHSKDGTFRKLKITYSPDLDERGLPRGFIAMAMDITEQTRLSDDVQRKAARLQFLSLIEEDTRTLHDPRQVMEVVTRLTATQFGASRCAYADVEADGDHFTIRHDFVADKIPSTEGYYSLALFGTETLRNLTAGRTLVLMDVKKELTPDNGGEMFAALNIDAIIVCPLVKDGKLKAMMAIHQTEPREWSQDEISLMETVAERSWSIIERVRFDIKLRESVSQFRMLADALPQIVFTARPDGYIDYYNQRWYDFTGFDRREGDGESWLELVHPDDLPHIRSNWYNCVETKTLYEIQFRIMNRKTGEYNWQLSRAIPVLDERGEITKWFGTNTDIQEIVEMREMAEEANIAKSEFLANMSHEIRTPMNAVVGLSNILSNSQPLTQQQKEYIKTLQLSADTLLGLINDLLDISKIESRTVELEQIEFDIAQLMQEVISIMSVRASEKNLAFKADLQPLEKKTYIGDTTRIRQIILNLCSNAVKFTHRGVISIDIVCSELEDGNENVCIKVKDTGIGIAPDNLDMIFHKFVQADTSISRKYGGSGLGLAITKTLVDIMGGTIHVESNIDKGSLFTVCLPLQKSYSHVQKLPETLAKPEPSAHDDRQLKVLLVEDYAPNVLVASTFLEQFGYECDVAVNGIEALEKIRSNSYAVVLMDVQMHGMNGLEATRFIRAYEEAAGKPRLPVIGMTAHALSGDRERCLGVGMDDYISKPFNPNELRDKLVQWAIKPY